MALSKSHCGLLHQIRLIEQARSHGNGDTENEALLKTAKWMAGRCHLASGTMARTCRNYFDACKRDFEKTYFVKFMHLFTLEFVASTTTKNSTSSHQKAEAQTAWLLDSETDRKFDAQITCKTGGIWCRFSRFTQSNNIGL